MSHERRFRPFPATTTTGRHAASPLVVAALALLAVALLALLFAARAGAASGFGPAADVTRSDDTGKVVFVATDPGAPNSVDQKASALSPK